MINLPAEKVLTEAKFRAIQWARFDAAWYRARYSDAADAIGSNDDAATLRWYLDHGQRQGHDPNRYFCEAWFLGRHHDIAEVVSEGRFPSGFDAYCRGNNRTRAPHWLFDERFYRARYPDLTDDLLTDAEMPNGYEHFLRHGCREGRIGHPLFDPAVYLDALPPEERAAATQAGPFHHYLDRLEAGRAAERTSVYFDPAWYLRHHPKAREAISRGQFRSALEHYLCNDTPCAFDPLPWFSEAWYDGSDPGLSRAIESGVWRNGYEHFLRMGVHEQRSPTRQFRMKWYCAQPAVQAALDRGLAPDGFTHFLTLGAAMGLPTAPPAEDEAGMWNAATLDARRTHAVLPRIGRHRLAFDCPDDPSVSIVVVLRDGFAQVLAGLAALRAAHPDPIDLILVDRGSRDGCRGIEALVSGAQVMRFDADIDLAAARNAGLQCARAQAVLFLDAGARVHPGGIASALRRLHASPSAGAVGGIVLSESGLITAAGGMIGANGAITALCADRSPDAPEAHVLREVDTCPGPFLMLRRDLASEIEGFDDRFRDRDRLTADLVLRMAARGHHVLHDPLVIVEAPSIGPGDPAQNAREQQSLAARHAGRLAAPRTRPNAPHRVLFIEDTVPVRAIGSGFVRSNDLVHAMAELGCAVTVFPVKGSPFDLASVYADFPDTVEVLHDRSLGGLPALLAEARSGWDTIWVARTHNLAAVLPGLQDTLAAADRPRLVLDTEALGSLRQAERHRIRGEAFDLNDALVREFEHAGVCDHVIAVSEAEAVRVRTRVGCAVSVIGHAGDARPTPRPVEHRNGMLFVGAIHETSSPNFDGLRWFVDSVLPLVERELGWMTRLTVAGYLAPHIPMDRFRTHPRLTLLGPVPDLTAQYDSHRLFVAPTRFAAGLPYKVHEAASFGLPVVATEILRSQLGWQNGEEIIAVGSAEPDRMAAEIVALYRDEARWQRIRAAALARFAADTDRTRFRAAVAAALGISDRPG